MPDKSEKQVNSDALMQWLNTPLGRYVRAWEHRQVSDLVANVFGYHAVQLGMPHWDLLRGNRIGNKFYTSVQHCSETVRSNLLFTEHEALPFAAQSVDLLILPHVLECSAAPHQVLREVDRVLRPDGTVVMTGFSPFSLWGLRERLPGMAPHLPIAPQHYISLARINDWLELLSFELQSAQDGCFVPLCLQRKWLKRWRFMDRFGSKVWWPIPGGSYVLKAVKRVNAMTLVGLEWSHQKTPAGRAAVAASQRTLTKH